MTATSPLPLSSASMCAWPGGSSSKVVLFGGNSYPGSSILQNQTYLFNGTTPNWSAPSSALAVDPAGPLPGRSDAVMSYDGTHICLFGGQSANGIEALGDTWLYNGTTWTVQTLTTAPAARYKAAAAYSSSVGLLVFGGQGTETAFSDTWLWNGTTWSQIAVANGAGPSARSGHCMAGSTSQILMFGGRGILNLDQSLWSYASGAWTQIVSANGVGPSARTGASMCFDTTAGLFVVYGGTDSAGNRLEDLYTFNPSGNVWTQVVQSGTMPPSIINGMMAYDSVSGKTILFGGLSGTTGAASNGTFSLTTSTGVWTQL